MSARPLTLTQALWTILVSGTFFVFLAPVFAPLGFWGLSMWQGFALFLPAIFAAWRNSGSWGSVGLFRPSPGILVGAVLIGASLWVWSLRWVAPIGADWGDPQALRNLEEFLSPQNHSLTQNLLALALVPAVCEELLHRGVLARALAVRLGTVPAIVLSALVFGASHLSWARFLPTTLLGLFAAFVCVVSRNVVAAMVLHFVYNACLILFMFGAIEPSDWWSYPAIGLSGLGMYLVWQRHQRTPVTVT